MDIKKNTEKIFIQVVKSALTHGKIDLGSQIDFYYLYKLCIQHSVSVMAFEVLKNEGNRITDNIYNRLKNRVYKDVCYAIQSECDVERIISAFEENGIKFIPLKGYFLKKLYSKPEMRYATDCDILIDNADIDKVHYIAKQLGMKLYATGDHHDIFYFPETKTVFEFHKSIFKGKLNETFGDGFNRAKLKEGYKCFYELPPEDFYISILGHSAYHFVHGGGVGIRHVIDVYLYKKAYKFDEEYLNKELEKCGLTEFREQFEKLADYFFANGEADEFTLKLADYVLSSSIFGNEDKKQVLDIVANTKYDNKSAKIKTLIKLIFPPFKTMKGYYPIIKKLPILLPFYYIARWFIVLIKRPKSLKKIKKIANASEQELNEIKTIRDKLGLKNL